MVITLPSVIPSLPIPSSSFASPNSCRFVCIRGLIWIYPARWSLQIEANQGNLTYGRSCFPRQAKLANMRNPRMRLFMSIVVSGSVVITAWHYWKPFFASGRVFKQSEFIGWAIKGFGIPVLFWILIYCGALGGVAPFIPKDALLYYIGTGTIVLASW